MRRIDHSKRDVAFASRRPGCRCHEADLVLAGALRVQQRIMSRLVALNVQPHEPTAYPAPALLQERAPSGEVALVKIHQPGKPELQRRPLASDPDRTLGRKEVDLRGNEARLDACDVQRLRADGADAARAAGHHQSVPYDLGGAGHHPDLIAQIPREAGARHRHRLRCDREAADLERPQALDSGETGGLQHREGGRPLQGERRNLLRDLRHVDFETHRRIQQPVDLSLGGAQPVLVLAEPEHRTIVDQMTGIVAPHAIGDPVDLELPHITRHQPVEIGRPAASGDAVLDHRSQVIERAGVADREIFLFDVREHIDGGVPGPGNEAVDLAQGTRTRMEWRLQQRLFEMRRADCVGGHIRTPVSTPGARHCVRPPP